LKLTIDKELLISDENSVRENTPMLDYKNISASIKRELSDVERRINRWYSAFEKGVLEPDELKERIKDLKNNKRHLEEKLKEIDKETETAKQKVENRKILIKRLKELPFLWERSTYEEQRKMVMDLVERVLFLRMVMSK
jgi:site-specific DNA recombinase